MNRLQLTPVVKQILIGCIVLFIGSMLLERNNTYNLNNLLAMHHPQNPLFKPWQIITHMFMHGGIAHIAFNMFALVSIGVVIERMMGSKKFFILYFLSGLGAIGLHLLIQAWEIYNITGLWFPNLSELGLKIEGDSLQWNGSFFESDAAFRKTGPIYLQTLLGASGAVYGVVAAFAFMLPNTELVFMFIPYPIKAKYLVPVIIGLDLFLGFSSFEADPIAHFAHLGGAITGLLTVIYWRRFDKRNFW